VNGIALTGSDYFQSNNCPPVLSAGSSCTINVIFTPSVAGFDPASLNIVDGLGTQSVSLTGDGFAQLPVANLSQSTLYFPGTQVGSSSQGTGVVLSNQGPGDLNIYSISFTSPDYTQSNNCPATLAVGSSCSINVTFSPSLSGGDPASLNIVDSAGTQSVSLLGSGI